MRSEIVNVHTGSRLVTDLTGEAAAFVSQHTDGLLSIFVPHATAGLALIETGAGSEPDLADALERLLPTQDIYRHRHGSLGHGRDHVMPAFVSSSLTVPVVAGRLTLGTWQSIVLVDPNGDNVDRHVRLSFVEG